MIRRRCRPLVLACLVTAWVAAARGTPLQEVRVQLPPGRGFAALAGIEDLEILGRGEGDLRLALSREGVERLCAEGWDVEILREDLESHYASLQQGAIDFGIWHTYAETTDELELLHAQYPGITTAPFSIGRSFEGREIWAIKISDDPQTDEGEPEVLFDGLHHAREIMSVEALLAFARYLCENDGVDPLVSYLVDNREIFFVPIVNPDGFVYNETIRPEGGGMWRKNRRPGEGECVGVDINRNYPFHWGGNSGSSGNPCSETYRGAYPASEPETQAMIEFIKSRRFVTHDSFHSVVGAILIPWCDSQAPTVDDALLREIAGVRSMRNGYVFGQCPEILYLVTGGMIDWTYGEQIEKPRILSFSTEVGGTGFWPAPSEREPLVQENIHSMLYLVQVAGTAISVDGLEIVAGGDAVVDPGEEGEIVVSVRSAGILEEARDVHARLTCEDPYVELADAAADLGAIPSGEIRSNDTDPFRFSVAQECPEGRRAPFSVVVTAQGAQRAEVAFQLDVGAARILASTDFESPDDLWQIDPSQTTPVGAFVRAEPHATPYQPGDDATGPTGSYAWITGQNVDESTDDVDDGVVASRSPLYDLSDRQHARMRMRYFHGQRDGGDDPGGDWFSIDASADAGASWVNLLRMDDQASLPDWRSLDLDLADVIPLTDQVCFRIQVADGPTERDVVEGGIDDFQILESAVPNTPPDPPVADAPEDGATGLGGWVSLSIVNAHDPDGDPLVYGFRVYSGDDPTRLVASADGVPEAGPRTIWRVDRRLDAGTYSWRVFADDAIERSYFSVPSSFTVTDSGGAGDLTQAVLVAAPNPHRANGAHLRVLLPGEITSELTIFDAQGRRVRRLDTPPSGSGWREIDWDGRDDEGRTLPAGSYFVRLRTPREARTLRVVRLP